MKWKKAHLEAKWMWQSQNLGDESKVGPLQVGLLAFPEMKETYLKQRQAVAFQPEAVEKATVLMFLPVLLQARSCLQSPILSQLTLI